VGIQPHYAAPVFCAFMTLVVESLRRIAVVRVGGVRVGRMAVGLTFAMVVVQLATIARVRASAPPGWETSRAAIESSLAARGGKHLVVVRYGPVHDPLREWVSNRADIDRAAVVWARDAEPERLGDLLRYFRDRSAWRLDADADPPRLTHLDGKTHRSHSVDDRPTEHQLNGKP
jgi:hypothetical protein